MCFAADRFPPKLVEAFPLHGPATRSLGKALRAALTRTALAHYKVSDVKLLQVLAWFSAVLLMSFCWEGYQLTWLLLLVLTSVQIMTNTGGEIP